MAIGHASNGSDSLAQDTCPLPLDTRHDRALTWGASIGVAALCAVSGARLPVELRYFAVGRWPQRGCRGDEPAAALVRSGWAIVLQPCADLLSRPGSREWLSRPGCIRLCATGSSNA